MNHETNHANSTGHGNYERRDISVAGVLYFILGLAVAGLVVHFVATGLFSYMQKQNEAQQAPVSPLVTNAPKDTRHLSVDYRDYLKQNFPSPQLEIDERSQLNDIRLKEEQTLNSYDYIDQQAGTVRIPIERAMDLIVQRGLPVRTQPGETAVASTNPTTKAKGPQQ